LEWKNTKSSRDAHKEMAAMISYTMARWRPSFTLNILIVKEKKRNIISYKILPSIHKVKMDQVYKISSFCTLFSF
jgi:hypothetical protein